MPTDMQNLPGTGLNGDHRVFSNFFNDNHIIQQSCVSHPKSLLIDSLRSTFELDTIYTYRSDEFGFPLTPDMTFGDIDALNTTKIMIGDSYRNEVKFYPSITVKSNGGSYKPLSVNQNYTIKYKKTLITDVNGIESIINVPTHRVYAGIWDMSYEVQIHSESFSELQEILDITAMSLQYSMWNTLRTSGLFINGLSISGESAEPYANDFLYTQSLTLKGHSEWRVEIPISNLIEKMIFYWGVTKTPIKDHANFDNLQLLKFDDIIELAEIKL